MQITLFENIHHILTYNKWANEKIVFNIGKLTNEDYYRKLSIPFNSIHGLLHHLFYYDAKYYSKFIDSSKHFSLEDITREYLTELLLLNSNAWLTWINKICLLKQLPELSHEISKSIINLSIHNNYHRGQLTVALSLMGYEPESLDVYIFNENL